jgi:hypothetical protein
MVALPASCSGISLSGRFATALWLVEVLDFIARVDHHSQVSLGEMVSYLPIPGGHIKLAERFVNGAFSFVCDFAMWL